MEKFWDFWEDEDKFVKPITFILGFVVIAAILGAADGLVKDLVTADVKRRIALYLIPFAIWIYYWLRTKYKLPQNDENHIGIVICVKTESDQEKIRLKEDFTERLNTLVMENNLHEIVKVHLLRNYQAERVVSALTSYQKNHPIVNPRGSDIKAIKKWNKLQNRMRGHFYVWGTIKRRQEGEATYFFQTNALVLHAPFKNDAHLAFNEEVNQIWTKLIKFHEKNEYAGFQFSADLIYSAAKYIIGTAALMSGDPPTALRLHENLENDLKRLRPLPARMKAMKNKLMKMLSLEYYSIAQTKRTDGAPPEELKNLIAKSIATNPTNVTAYNLQAIFEFEYEHDAQKALSTIRRGKQFGGENNLLAYSEAFLLMYLERFDRGLKLYRQIVQGRRVDEVEKQILESVYAFNEKTLREEPRKIQCRFIIGYLKYRREGNGPEALDYFDQFLREVPDQRHYKPLIDEARAYKKDIEQELSLP